jgi:DNA mismatch repair protein MutH
MNYLTLEALKHKLSVAEDEADADHNEPEDQKQWREVVSELTKAIESESIKDNQCAAEELQNYIDGDLNAAEKRAILRDLGEAGFLEEFNPKAFYSRRPKTMKIGTKVYLV